MGGSLPLGWARVEVGDLFQGPEVTDCSPALLRSLWISQLLGHGPALPTQHPEGCYGNHHHPSGSFQIFSINRDLWALLCLF